MRNLSTKNISHRKKWHGRFATIIASSVFMVIGLVLILKTFNDNIVFFYTPSELVYKERGLDKPFRVGGLVKDGTVKKSGSRIDFVITDFNTDLMVVYEGFPPALFKEGQGAVAFGNIGSDGIFVATEILAKHDENYMPREVQNSLKKSGYWKDGN